MPKHTKSWPFRQDDPRWSEVLMWDRAQVIKVHHRFNGATVAASRKLLRRFKSGNTIGNEGCLLTSLAMVLHLLEPERRWNPIRLHRFAQRRVYYTNCGLSMAPLYADLVCEASAGDVQLLLKEEYLSGEAGWPRNYPSTCVPLRAYRKLSSRAQRDIVVMLKIGTYDDTVGSHYVLVDPDNRGDVGDDDVALLDPAEPQDSPKHPWLLVDSSHRICEDPAIRRSWRRAKIGQLQIAGVCVFARWRSGADTVLGHAFLKAMSGELG